MAFIPSWRSSCETLLPAAGRVDGNSISRRSAPRWNSFRAAKIIKRAPSPPAELADQRAFIRRRCRASAGWWSRAGAQRQRIHQRQNHATALVHRDDLVVHPSSRCRLGHTSPCLPGAVRAGVLLEHWHCRELSKFNRAAVQQAGVTAE